MPAKKSTRSTAIAAPARKAAATKRTAPAATKAAKAAAKTAAKTAAKSLATTASRSIALAAPAAAPVRMTRGMIVGLKVNLILNAKNGLRRVIFGLERA